MDCALEYIFFYCKNYNFLLINSLKLSIHIYSNISIAHLYTTVNIFNMLYSIL